MMKLMKKTLLKEVSGVDLENYREPIQNEMTDDSMLS